jgi:hypothetical protein
MTWEGEESWYNWRREKRLPHGFLMTIDIDEA